MSVVVVERTFESPPSDADLKAVADRQALCLNIYGVTYTKSILSNDRKRMICEYVAADTESVRKVQREAQVPFINIWAGIIIK